MRAITQEKVTRPTVTLKELQKSTAQMRESVEWTTVSRMQRTYRGVCYSQNETKMQLSGPEVPLKHDNNPKDSFQSLDVQNLYVHTPRICVWNCNKTYVCKVFIGQTEFK